MAEQWRVCNQQGCPELTTGRRCDDHTREVQRNQAAQRRAAGDESMTTYATTAWRQTRARFVKAHPLCVECGAPVHDVDHVVPRQILVAAGITNPDHHQWLQPLCSPCHSRKTSTVDKLLLARLRDGEPAGDLAAEVYQRNYGA